MNSKIYSILLAVLLSFSMPPFLYTGLAVSTTVSYTSERSTYYELSVPTIMYPGDTASVMVTGTWNSLSYLEITADRTVTLVNSLNGEEKVLDVYFDGILQYGNDTDEICLSKEITVEPMNNAVFGTWTGSFNYTVNMFEESEPDEAHSGVIPDGGTYYALGDRSSGSWGIGNYSDAIEIYYSGEEFPDEVSNGDIYVYGDYEYRYQCGYEGWWYNSYTSFNWGVTAIDNTKSTYSKILGSINGKDVDNLAGTFWNCSNIDKSPQLPKCVKNMSYTFYHSALSEPPVIPDGVTRIYRAFESCKNLKQAPVLSDTINDMEYAFLDCSALEVPPVIHNNITYMQEAFSGCTSLSGTIEINAENLIRYDGVLFDTNITEITGSIPDELKAEILATK